MNPPLIPRKTISRKVKGMGVGGAIAVLVVVALNYFFPDFPTSESFVAALTTLLGALFGGWSFTEREDSP